MVYVMMTFPKSEKHDGILLALSNGRMRIALEGGTDVVELRKTEGQWTLDDGTLVELDGLFTDGNTDIARFSELYPRASAAGNFGESAVTPLWARYQPLSATSVH